MINSDFLAREMEAEGFAPTENQLEKFDRYASMLVEWNEKINLTAITEPDEIVIKHFIDSLLFFIRTAAACHRLPRSRWPG